MNRKPDVLKVIDGIKKTIGNRKYCYNLPEHMSDYAGSIVGWLKATTPANIDALVEHTEELQRKVEALAVENAEFKSFGDKLDEMHNALNGEGTGIQGREEVACQQIGIEAVMDEFHAIKTPATEAVIAEMVNKGKVDGVKLAFKTLEESAFGDAGDLALLVKLVASLRKEAGK